MKHDDIDYISERASTRLLLFALLCWLLGGILIGMAGCKSVPVLDEQGQPTAETKLVPDKEAIADGLNAAADVIPPPFSYALMGAAGLLTLRRKPGGKDE